MRGQQGWLGAALAYLRKGLGASISAIPKRQRLERPGKATEILTETGFCFAEL